MHNEAVMPIEVSPDSEDDSLIARFLAGDEGAFETLFRKYQFRFQAVCQRFLGSASEAEDVTQETFVDIYHGLRRFQRHSSFSTWAYRILARKCGERRKRLERQGLAETQPNTLDSLPAPDGLPLTESMLIAQAMARLSDQARMALILKYYEQLSSEEIAAVLNCNVGQAKMRVHRAKNALKELLKPMWEGEK